MWQGFTIALREGIESFLIIALTVAYLRKTGRRGLLPAVGVGAAVALFISFLAGYGLSRASNQPLWEGVLAVVAALLVGSLLVWMLKSARNLKADMERRLGEAVGSDAKAGFWGVLLFTVLMLTREGMETALLITTALFQLKSATLVTGLLCGLLAAAIIGGLWTRLGRRVPVGVLLNVSAVFLAIFLVQLVLNAIHELSEANLLPRSEAIHAATEVFGPDGRIGHAITYLLAAAPTVILLAWWRGNQRTPPAVARVPVESRD